MSLSGFFFIPQLAANSKLFCLEGAWNSTFLENPSSGSDFCLGHFPRLLQVIGPGVAMNP